MKNSFHRIQLLLCGTVIVFQVNAQGLLQQVRQLESAKFNDSSPRVLSGYRGIVTTGIADPDLFWEWDPEPRWLTGRDWGARTFFGSLDLGRNFLGSTLEDSQYVEVEIRFSIAETTFCQTYRRDLGYPAAGIGLFRGSAWDISKPQSPRRLNMCFVEDSTAEKLSNLEWDPDSSTNGGREYLFIMLSDYDSTGLTYDDKNWGPGSDVLYAWWPRLESGHSFLETDPATLRIRFSYIRNFRAIPDEAQLTLTWAFDEPGIEKFRLYYSTTSPANILLDSLSADSRAYVHTGLTNETDYLYRIEAESAASEVLFVSPEISARPQVVYRNVELLGAWHGRRKYGDMWGYTDPVTGREYALLCVRDDGLSIIDLSEQFPSEVGFVSSLSFPTDAKDVKVYDHYAILIKEHEPAQVIDLSDPSNPITVSTIPFEGGAGAHNCFVDGDFLYVVGNHGAGGLIIYDLSDPTNPTYAGEYQPYYYHDIYVRNDTAYAAAINGEGVDILDVSDKTQPSLIVNFNYPGSGAHNCWTTEDGNYLVVGDEVGSGTYNRIFDIRDLGNIQQVASYVVDTRAIVHNSYVRGNYLYVAHYTEGLRIVDISDPTQPVEVAYYDTYLPAEYGFKGCWTVYPYFESGKLIASDMQTGLYVVRIDSTLVPVAPRDDVLPTVFYLEQNYPNPFNPSTTIHYELPSRARVVLKIFSLLGQEVTTLVDDEKSAGRYGVRWDAIGISSGVYFYRLSVVPVAPQDLVKTRPDFVGASRDGRASDFIETKKMIVLQ